MGFSVPSLTSLRSLIDTEPQVLYPVSATNTRPPSSPLRNGGGKCLPPVPDDWGREGDRGRTRRSSVTASTSSGLGLSGLTPTPAGGGGRPTHRRSHSAVPAINASPSLSALGRLTEYARNPLAASTSALSLPTLAEVDCPPNSGGVLPPTTPRARRGSRASIIYTSTTSGASVPPSPRRGIGVPASLPDLIVPPPPRARRPLPPPRSKTSLDVRSPGPHTEPPSPVSPHERREMDIHTGPEFGNLTRHASYTKGNHSKGRGSVGDISHVPVLATISVPTSPKPNVCISPATERLTSLTDSLPVPMPLPVPRFRPTHRATHSSPNVLATSRLHLASSPGSLLSSDGSSPTSSLNSLEPAPAPAQVGWKMPWASSRRGSMASIFSTKSAASANASVGAREDGDVLEEQLEGLPHPEEEEDSEEEYIDFDQIPVR